ncbi:hypothetical protein ABZV91_03390 [Nocardia sp. NPDC004568]
MSSVSRFLRMEEPFGIETGHAEIPSVVEDFLRKTEGERRRAGE